MSAIFDSIVVADDIKRYVEHSFDIVDQIQVILDRQGKTQRDLANLLGKKESEISKWMRGTHNFTLKSIAKIETVLAETIVLTPSKAQQTYAQVKMIPVKVTARANNRHQITEASSLIIWAGGHEVYSGGLKTA